MKKLFLLSALTLSMSIAAVAQQTEAVQTEVNQYGQKVNSYPVDATVQDGILVFQNKTQNYKMWFDIRVLVMLPYSSAMTRTSLRSVTACSCAVHVSR